MKLINAEPIANGIANYLLTNAYLNDTAQDVLEMVGKWVNDAPAVEILILSAFIDTKTGVPGMVLEIGGEKHELSGPPIDLKKFTKKLEAAGGPAHGDNKG